MVKYHKKLLFPLNKQSSDDFKTMNPTSTVIRNIKVHLMSRTINKQVHAIDVILSHLKNKGSELRSDVLIYSDIPGLLCDVMNNYNPSLIKKVITCLLELSKNGLFYEEKHSAIAIETTIRTIKILLEDVANKTVIFYGLQLLSQILSMSNSDSAVNLVQVMELIKNILFSNLFQTLHLNAIFLLRCVMRLREFRSQEELPLVHHVLNLFSQLQKNNKAKFNKHISLANDIMLFSLRIASSVPSHPISQKCEEQVWVLVQSSVTHFIKMIKVKKCHAGIIKKQLLFLVGILEHLDFKSAIRLSNKLACKGFLTILPLINSHYNEKTVSACGMSLLSQMLEILANTTLKLSDKENQLISDGLLCLPVDATMWPLLLGQKLPSKVYYAVIVYLYFVLLCTKSFDKAPVYLPVLCTFMKSQTSTPSPAMLKAVWFLFAVASLSKKDGKRESKRREESSANCVLVRWLQTVPLSTVYTPHPALLFWTFGQYASNRTLEINLMNLWLKAKDKYSVEQMKEIVLKNRRAACCILDVLVECPSETISQVMAILKTVLNRDKNQGCPDTSNRLWSNLPQTLSLLTTPHQESKVSNVSCMLFLACKVVPTSPDTVLLLRISYQLLVLLQRPIKDINLSRVLHAQLFKLANILIIKMNQAKDCRVLELFLQDEVLLRALLTSLSSENSIVTLPALRLMSYLQYFQKLSSIKTKSCMYVSGETLLQLMNTPRMENKLATLNLFSLLQATNNMSPVVALSTVTADHILQDLYLNLQMMTVQTNESWRCLNLLLEFCKVHNPKMELHFLTQPWTYLAIQSAIDVKNPEVFIYLSEWLSRLLLVNAAPNVSYLRAICQDRLSSTLTLVARELLHKYNSNNSFDSLYVEITSQITRIGVDIPKPVYQSLEENIMDNYIVW